MELELRWREHLSQEKEKRHCCYTRKLGIFIEEDFKPKRHLEKCALAQGTLWHIQRTFSVDRTPGNWNPGFHQYQKTRSTRKPKVPKNQKYPKTRSSSPKIRWSSFMGQKLEFSETDYTSILTTVQRIFWWVQFSNPRNLIFLLFL